FDLLQATERGVLLQRGQMLQFLLQQRDDLLFLLLSQPELDRELVGKMYQPVDADLRRRGYLIVGEAEFVTAGAIVGIAKLVDRDRVRLLRDERDEFAALDLVRGGGSLVAAAHS